MTAQNARTELKKYASLSKAKILSGFFKTGPGEYGEGDIFIGVKVPDIRRVARQFKPLSKPHVLTLLRSPIHEERLLALLILIAQFESGDKKTKKHITRLYLDNSCYCNNWDLIDVSAHKILGRFLEDKSRRILYKLARSKNMWQRRMSIVSTLTFIRNNDFSDTFFIADILQNDREDLLHKAAGWMLREAGKRDTKALENFLKTRYNRLPRTMLRYAIERFPQKQRQRYLTGKI
ncbi:MAG: DNA alkylation repair protein [Candidatus Omnitrophica bacterium]|nr:DNA alkylation repair protein [Candidatus Omnitrophota bacterium]